MLSQEQLKDVKTKGRNLIEVLKCKSPKETYKKVLKKIDNNELSNLCIGDYIPLENGMILVIDVL